MLIETPFQMWNGDGQVLSGFIDLALETGDGWVIIDHKTFQGSGAGLVDKTLSFSGQLNVYRDALDAVGLQVQSTWIHFPVAGSMLELKL